MAVKIPSMLDKMSPTFQKAWYKKNKMPLPAHLTGSVGQAKKEIKPSERVKKLQAQSIKAYGATKGAKVGGEHGSEEMRDTIAPLTRDQHSKVQAAARAAKAAAPAKPKKPLTKSERMAAIAAAVRKTKTKYDVPTVDPDDVDHDDLRDVHQSLHVSRGYNEEVEIEEAKKPLKPSYWRAEWRLGTKTEVDKNNKKIYDRLAKSDPAKAKAFHDNLMKIRKEEVDQIDELKSSTLQSYLDKRPSPKIRDIARAETVGKPEERQKDINRANLTRIGRARAKVKLLKRNPPPKTTPTTDGSDRGYGQGRYMGDDVNLEGQVMNEGKMKDIVTDRQETARLKAQEVLGGPVKEKPKGPAGKLPLGFRMARSAARKAMKGQIDAVHRSMEKTMKKEEIEQVIEQDDSMEKKEMAQTQLHFIKYAAEEILSFIDMGGEVEEWYQNKLSKVQSEVESLHSYIEGEKRRTGMVKEEEQIDEVSTEKLKRYQQKISDDSLKHNLDPSKRSPEKRNRSVAGFTRSFNILSKRERDRNEKVKAHFEEVEQGVAEGFDPSSAEIAKMLVKKHGAGNVTKQHIQDMEADRDSYKGLDHDEIMKHVKKMSEEVEQVDEKYMGFKAVMAAAKEGGARDPAAVAAAIGRKKYGKEKFQAAAAAGKKMGEEVEVVAEAEGTVAVTPKEKALAAHHGDPKKITYGDVIKARLKSVASKKMGKK